MGFFSDRFSKKKKKKIDTEIDWIAYMQQVKQYLDGERDYMVIKGDTGPLVYPAAHVYIYTGLYRLTDGGKDIKRAQIIFMGLYLGVLSLVMACYRKAKVKKGVFFCVHIHICNCPIEAVGGGDFFLTYLVAGLELFCLLCLFYMPGTTLHIPSSGNLQAPSQYLPPEAFQRLFRRRGLVPCYLRLPETPLGRGQCGIFMGCGY